MEEWRKLSTSYQQGKFERRGVDGEPFRGSLAGGDLVRALFGLGARTRSPPANPDVSLLPARAGGPARAIGGMKFPPFFGQWLSKDWLA